MGAPGACPVCGGEPQPMGYYAPAHSGRYVRFHFVRCRWCGVRTLLMKGRAQAVREWNRYAEKGDESCIVQGGLDWQGLPVVTEEDTEWATS